MVLSSAGDILYVSETVSGHLGHSQVRNCLHKYGTDGKNCQTDRQTERPLWSLLLLYPTLACTVVNIQQYMY